MTVAIRITMFPIHKVQTENLHLILITKIIHKTFALKGKDLINQILQSNPKGISAAITISRSQISIEMKTNHGKTTRTNSHNRFNAILEHLLLINFNRDMTKDIKIIEIEDFQRQSKGSLEQKIDIINLSKWDSRNQSTGIKKTIDQAKEDIIMCREVKEIKEEGINRGQIIFHPHPHKDKIVQKD